MKTPLLRRCAINLLWIWSIPPFLPVFAATPDTGSLLPNLDLITLERIALERDSLTRAGLAKSQALMHEAKAVDSLPDPRIKLGAVNLPTDTYAFDQVQMSQKVVGLQQMFPAWGTLDNKAARLRHLAVAESHQVTTRQLEVLRETRQAWLELYYWEAADAVVQENKQLFNQLVRITELQYASGRQNQQDVLRAELELGLLEDKQHQIFTRIEQARADLAKWVGPDLLHRPLPSELPQLKEISSLPTLRDVLPQHPLVKQTDAMVAAAQSGIDVARSRYRPSVAVDLTYGQREGEYPDGRPWEDFASAVLSLSVPINPLGRQGEQVDASVQHLQAAQQQREEKLRMLEQKLGNAFAAWKHLGERATAYEQQLIPRAEGTAEAALRAYQNDRAKFTDLMRARIISLDTRLQYLRLLVDRTKTQAQLIYLSGVSQ